MPDQLPNTYLVGFFTVDGEPSVIEVPCTGNGRLDNENLKSELKRKHPTGEIVRVGSTIERRDPDTDPGFIVLDSGDTLQRLFDSEDPARPLTSRRIGRAFFTGTPCDILLTFDRAHSTVGVRLLPRIKVGDGVITFSNRINSQLLVSELPRLIKDVLGRDARDIVLRTKENA